MVQAVGVEEGEESPETKALDDPRVHLPRRCYALVDGDGDHAAVVLDGVTGTLVGVFALDEDDTIERGAERGVERGGTEFFYASIAKQTCFVADLKACLKSG